MLQRTKTSYTTVFPSLWQQIGEELHLGDGQALKRMMKKHAIKHSNPWDRLNTNKSYGPLSQY